MWDTVMVSWLVLRYERTNAGVEWYNFRIETKVRATPLAGRVSGSWHGKSRQVEAPTTG